MLVLHFCIVQYEQMFRLLRSLETAHIHHLHHHYPIPNSSRSTLTRAYIHFLQIQLLLLLCQKHTTDFPDQSCSKQKRNAERWDPEILSLALGAAGSCVSSKNAADGPKNFFNAVSTSTSLDLTNHPFSVISKSP